MSSVSSAFTGDWSSGGGDAVILPGDTVVLADPYTPRYGDVGELHPALIEELQRASKLLVRYGASIRYYASQRMNEWQYLSRFFEEAVFHSLIEYRFVDELPKIMVCQSELEPWPIPPGSESHAIACTQGPVTWIKASLFRKMTVREQAKTILHERLHTLPTSAPHEFIADITQGIGLALELYNEQFQGRRPVVGSDQVGLLSRMVRRIVQLKLSSERRIDERQFIDDWIIAPNGGGLAHRAAWVDPNAYVGVGSLVNEASRLEAGSEILFTSCYDLSFEPPWPRFYGRIHCELKKGSALKNTILIFGTQYRGHIQRSSDTIVRLDEEALIKDSFLSLPSNPDLGEFEAQIEHGKSAVMNNVGLQYFGRIYLEPGSKIERVVLTNSVSSDKLYKTDWGYPAHIHLGSGAEWLNMTNAIRFLSSKAIITNSQIEQVPELYIKPQTRLNISGIDLCRHGNRGYYSSQVVEGHTPVGSLQDFLSLCGKGELFNMLILL